VLHATNFSRGVEALGAAVEGVVGALPGYDVELTETHHNRKRDAPSGTAGTLLDRIETAREISRATRDSAETVVIARAGEYADALAGAPLAAHLDAPVLLTGSSSLHSATADEIARLGAAEAVLLGGEAALSEQVADDLADVGVATRRLGGADRFATAALVAGELPAADEVYVAEGIHDDPGRGWPDAMSAAGLAAGQRAPVLLVAHGLLPDATADAIAADQDVAIVGGTAAVSADVVDAVDDQADTVRRLSGSTRYATSAEAAAAAVAAGADPATTWAATGRDWADALVSAAATGRADGTLVLIDGEDLAFSPDTRDWIADHADQLATLNLAGGTAAISSDTADALTALIEP
jgi:putative cell wall-binding protein